MHQVAGSIQLLGLLDLLQVAAFNHRDFLLYLTHPTGQGMIHLHDGLILHAELGTKVGQDALFPLLTQSCIGEFTLGPSSNPPTQRTIEMSMDAILMKVAMQIPAEAFEMNNPTWTIEGDTDLLSVQELLQIFENNKKPASIRLENEEVLIEMADGGIYQAEMPGFRGAEAIYRTLDLTGRSFRLVSPAEAPQAEKILDVASVVMEGLRRRDEQKRLHTETSVADNPHARETLEALEQGNLDEPARIELARRYLPGGEMAPAFIVARLTVDESETVRATAIATIHDFPEAIMEALATDPESPPPLLRYLLLKEGASFCEVAKAAIRNPYTPEDSIVEYAKIASAAVMDAFHDRTGLLQESRGLRAALMANSHCPFVEKLRELDKKAKPVLRKRSFAMDVKKEPEVDLELPPEDPKKETVKQTKLGPKELQFIARRGSLRQKMALACGNDDEIAHDVVSQPGLPEPFIMGVAESTAANSAALKFIGGSTSFKRNQSIVKALLFNPKTPVPTSVSLLPLVRIDMIQKIADSRDVPDGLKQIARQTVDKKKKH